MHFSKELVKSKLVSVFRHGILFFGLDRFLRFFTIDKGYENFFVRCLPLNVDYHPGSIRRVRNNGFLFDLDLSQYMEWVMYFRLNIEGRKPLYDLITPGMIIMDVGTNIGETLLNFAKLTGPNGFVFGFEPVNSTYDKCISNIQLNDLSNLKVENKALSDSDEVLYFDPAFSNNSGGISMSKSVVNGSSMVNALTLDSYVEIQNLTRLDFIKVDVEGFELNVLKGARRTCMLYKPQLFIEVDDSHLRRQGTSSQELLDLIDSYGYIVKQWFVSEYAQSTHDRYDILAVFKETKTSSL